MDPTQIGQILANLCVNARDSIEDTGNITIETSCAALDEHNCSHNPGAVPGRYTVLTVSDDGHGIDADILDNIFEPFFTTKEAGYGTGLGLATVYGIVKQNNGYINVYSEPGMGTTFRLYFPESSGDDTVSSPETTAPVDLSDSAGNRVLLVEDDRAILGLGEKMLTRLGYTVLAANTPGDAIEIAMQSKEEIHLVMTDVIMPQMNGRQLSERIKELYPDVKVLFMSGYTANVIAQHGILDDGVQFLHKPFSMKSLASKLRTLFS